MPKARGKSSVMRIYSSYLCVLLSTLLWYIFRSLKFSPEIWIKSMKGAFLILIMPEITRTASAKIKRIVRRQVTYLIYCLMRAPTPRVSM